MGFARNMEGDRGVRREVARGGIMMVDWLKLVLFTLALTSGGYAQTSRPDTPAATQPAHDPAPTGFLAGPRVSDGEDDSSAPFSGRQRDQSAVPAREWFRVLDGLRLDRQRRAAINRIRRELRRARGAPGARPDVEAYQRRIWALLDDAHRARMRSELTEARRRIARDRAGDDTPAPGPGSVELDEAGRRRLAFLVARQSRRRRAPSR
jgi:hypothetical protein